MGTGDSERQLSSVELETMRRLIADATKAEVESLCSQVIELAAENESLRAETERLRELLVRWLEAVPGTHTLLDGRPLPWVNDTLVALGREPLKPMTDS